ncbi:formate dehydrogenase subunit gamma [Chloroflexota bacterium]
MSATKPVVSEKEIVRFDTHQIVQHVVLMVTFTLLASTGLPMKFHDWAISQWWTRAWGGIEVMRSVHRFAAWAMILDCLYHLAYLSYTTLVLKRPLPIRMVPSPKDFRDFFQEMGYFLGLVREQPKFDRFNWREKFDYWAIFWGLPVIGISGFIMAYPVFATRLLPGWVVPAAFVAHGDEAVLAVAWIFMVHFVFNHLAPGVFPLNTSIFTGRVREERYRHEHPLEYERLLGSEGEPGRREQIPAEALLGILTGASAETSNGAMHPKRKEKGTLRELLSDVVVATGAALFLFSIGLLFLVTIAAMPGGNPYIGILLFVFLPIVAVGGFLVFYFGVVLDRTQSDSENRIARNPEGQSQTEEGRS